MTADDFAVVSMDGESLNGKKASKEFTLHKYYYEKDSKVQAVVHTHGPVCGTLVLADILRKIVILFRPIPVPWHEG
ncbi:MAG: class II aldolase/adducin family protein [Clostridium sp.]